MKNININQAKKSHLKTSKGIALVEVIAALGIAVVVLTALVSLSLFTLRATLSNKLQLEGTKWATRESELIRAYRDQSDFTWAMFISNMTSCTSPCCINTETDPISVQHTYCVASAGTPEEVIWSFTATNLTGGALTPTDTTARFNIKATWIVGGVLKQTNLYTDLSNWREKE